MGRGYVCCPSVYLRGSFKEMDTFKNDRAPRLQQLCATCKAIYANVHCFAEEPAVPSAVP